MIAYAVVTTYHGRKAGSRPEIKMTVIMLFVFLFVVSPRAANKQLTNCCLDDFARQSEFLGRLELSVDQLVKFSKEGARCGDGRVKAKRQELPLKNEGGVGEFRFRSLPCCRLKRSTKTTRMNRLIKTSF